MKGLWLRALAWMQSLEALNHTKHYQAISTGNRALLEIAVDLILLHHDKTNRSGWKMLWYAESEKLKSAYLAMKYFNEKGIAIPDVYKPLEEFYLSNNIQIDNMRRFLWTNKKKPLKAEHPKRWTGRSDLSKDIEEADKLFSSAIVADLGMTLTQYYRTEYSKMNWHIHSGVASFWNLPPETFNLICAKALDWCANLAMFCTKIVLIDFQFNKAITGLNEEWDDLKSRREWAVAEKLHNAKQPKDNV